MTSRDSLIYSLFERELGCKKWRLPNLTKQTEKTLNAEFGGIMTLVNNLRTAIEENSWPEIEIVVADVIVNLLDNSDLNQLFSLTPKKKQQRECFVTRGGIDLLMQLFRPPFVPATDGRSIPAEFVRSKSETWNEVLVILREVTFALPTLSEKTFKTEQVVFLFSLLNHQSLFVGHFVRLQNRRWSTRFR